MSDEFRLDELARRANVATTTVRLYRSRGLLPPPRLEGRTGWYNEEHVRRLRLIGRLQHEGHSLTGIGKLVEQWERGRSLDEIVEVEAELDVVLGEAHAVVLDAADLLERFPPDVMTPELMQRAAGLGLIELRSDATVRVADRRFTEAGSALAHLGVPLETVLDEWEVLVSHSDDIAERFITLFEDHLVPSRDDLATIDAAELASTLAGLRATAHQVIDAALDASIARVGRNRLSEVIDLSAVDEET